MRCEKCRSYFVGDTSLCPACEGEQFAAEAERQAAKIVKEILRFLPCVLIANAVIFIGLLALSIAYLPALFITVPCMIAVIYWQVNIGTEMSIWSAYRPLLKSHDQTAFKERIARHPAAGLYIQCASRVDCAHLEWKVGFIGDGLDGYYRALERQIRIIRRYRNFE